MWINVHSGSTSCERKPTGENDGTVKWIIQEVDLHEVSVCTFPAYEDTGVQARHAQVEQYREKQVEQWRNNAIKRLKGEK